MILKCIPHGTAVQPCESCRLMGNISASWVNGFWWALLVVCELPCFAGRQDLVLPQRALTHSSANTKQHLKLWSCCPCCTFCQAALQITRETFFFPFFFLPESFRPSVRFLWILFPLSLFVDRRLLLSFSLSSLVLSLPQPPLQINSVKILWQMFLPHPTFRGLAGGSVSLPPSLSSVSLVTEECNLCGCWGLWDWATMQIGRGGRRGIIHHP